MEASPLSPSTVQISVMHQTHTHTPRFLQTHLNRHIGSNLKQFDLSSLLLTHKSLAALLASLKDVASMAEVDFEVAGVDANMISLLASAQRLSDEGCAKEELASEVLEMAAEYIEKVGERSKQACVKKLEQLGSR